MTVEQRLEQLEKRNKRLTVALTMMVVAMAAVVTMAATNVKDVSNSEIGRYEYHRDQPRPAVSDAGTGSISSKNWPYRSHYLLDTVIGELWQIGLTTKQRVVEGKVNEN